MSLRASAAVIAAGIVCIIASSLAVLGQFFAVFGMFLVNTVPTGQSLPASVKTLTFAVLFLFVGIGVFGIFTGIGILRLKNWARISILIWSGITVFFVSFMLLFLLVMPFPTVTAPPSLPDGASAPVVPVLAMKVFLSIFCSIPLGITVWWLILFNRKGIRAQFTGTTDLAVAAQPEGPILIRPRCPLALAIIAGFLLFSFATTLTLPLLHFPLPVILFGRRIHGNLGFSFFFATTVLLAFAAIGLLKLKRWSYPLLLGLQLFWLASGTVTFLSPNYPRQMQEVLDEMPIPQNEVSAQMLLHGHSWALVGLLPALAIVVILLYYRDRFMKAVEAAEQAAAS